MFIEYLNDVEVVKRINVLLLKAMWVRYVGYVVLGWWLSFVSYFVIAKLKVLNFTCCFIEYRINCKKYWIVLFLYLVLAS